MSTDTHPLYPQAEPPSGKPGLGGLIAILAGIFLGAVAGLVFGRSMWLASGGPTRSVDRWQKTIAQKQTFAEAAMHQAADLRKAGQVEQADRQLAEAERLRQQIPVVERSIAEMRQLQAEADKRGVSTFAWLGWTLTEFFGTVFLQMLKLMVIPLVVTSMICGITSLGDIRKVGRLGAVTVGYYMVTTAIAVIIGIGLVQLIQPGRHSDDTFALVPDTVMAKKDGSVIDTLLAVVRGQSDDPGSGMFPENIFLAATQTNVLALIVFALVFGGALTTIGPKGKLVIEFFDAVNEAVMKMVHLIMWIAPVGIFSLVCFNIAKNGGASGFGEELRRLGWYVFTVILGLSLHGLVLASLLFFVGRRNPVVYTFGLLRALLTALSTSSSAATLPITMECVEENNGVSNQAASFVLPLGATINMDGTALYEAVAVIFIAQSLNVPLSSAALVVIFLTATLAAIGAAGIPEAGLVTMVIVLTAVGLPTSGIGTILAIDWFLDRLRTTINVYGDAVGSGIIDRYLASRMAKA